MPLFLFLQPAGDGEDHVASVSVPRVLPREPHVAKRLYSTCPPPVWETHVAHCLYLVPTGWAPHGAKRLYLIPTGWEPHVAKRLYSMCPLGATRY